MFYGGSEEEMEKSFINQKLVGIDNIVTSMNDGVYN